MSVVISLTDIVRRQAMPYLRLMSAVDPTCQPTVTGHVVRSHLILTFDLELIVVAATTTATPTFLICY